MATGEAFMATTKEPQTAPPVGSRVPEWAACAEVLETWGR